MNRSDLCTKLVLGLLGDSLTPPDLSPLDVMKTIIGLYKKEHDWAHDENSQAIALAIKYSEDTIAYLQNALEPIRINRKEERMQ
jgi:hypothetical protein